MKGALLPPAALLAAAAVPLPLFAHLAPGVEGLAMANTLATGSGWAVALVVAVGLPPLLIAAMESGGVAHTALGPLVGNRRRAVAATLAAALVSLAAALPAAALAHRLGATPVAALFPGGCALAAATAAALLGRRLAASRRLAVAYAATASLLALLGAVG